MPLSLFIESTKLCKTLRQRQNDTFSERRQATHLNWRLEIAVEADAVAKAIELAKEAY